MCLVSDVSVECRLVIPWLDLLAAGACHRLTECPVLLTWLSGSWVLRSWGVGVRAFVDVDGVGVGLADVLVV